jgi:flagellar hook-associated protein 1 FlgK
MPAPGPLSGVTVNGLDISPGSGYPGAIQQRPPGRRVSPCATPSCPQAQAQIDEIASTLADGFQRADASVGSRPERPVHRQRRRP